MLLKAFPLRKHSVWWTSTLERSLKSKQPSNNINNLESIVSASVRAERCTDQIPKCGPTSHTCSAAAKDFQQWCCPFWAEHTQRGALEECWELPWVCSEWGKEVPWNHHSAQQHRAALSQCLLLATITNQLFPLVSWKGWEHRLAKDCRHPGMTSHRCFKGSCAEHRRHCLTCPATPSCGCRNEKCSPGASSYKLEKAGENSLKSQRPPFKCACRSISLSIKCFWTPIKQSTGGAGMALNNLCTRWCLHAKCTKSHTSYLNLYFFVHFQ